MSEDPESCRALRPMSQDEAARLRPLVEVAHDITFWGIKYRVTPRLIPIVIGAGDSWMYLEPLNSRPNYYVFKCDARLSTSNFDPSPVFADVLDEVHEFIIDEFGRYGEGEENEVGEWPALSDDSGVSWGRMTSKWCEEIQAAEQKSCSPQKSLT